MNITQLVEECFKSPLGQQLDELFSTSDNMIFIRQLEAREHANYLEDKSILHWFEEYNGCDPEPVLRNELID